MQTRLPLLFAVLLAAPVAAGEAPGGAAPAKTPAAATADADKQAAAEKAPEKSPADAVTVERIAAVVNSEVILLSEVKDRASQLGQPTDDSAGPPEQRRKVQQILRQVVDRMIDDALVVQQGTELKLIPETAEIDRSIEEIRKSNGLTDDKAFRAALVEQGYTMESFRKDMRRQVLRVKVINTAVRSRINISDEEVKAFYEQSARQSGGHREAHLRHVLIAVGAKAGDKELDEKRKLAVKVLEQARGGADFAALAKAYSDDAATKTDGDLGWVKEGEGLPEALGEVIFAMDEKNEVRGPIRTDRGFEIVQLLDRREGDVRPFSEVRDQIRQQLYSQQLEKQTQTWLVELRKKAHVDIRL